MKGSCIFRAIRLNDENLTGGQPGMKTSPAATVATYLLGTSIPVLIDVFAF